MGVLDLKFGIGKIIVLVGAILLFVCTFFPWYATEIEVMGISESDSINAWDSDVGKLFESEKMLNADMEEESLFWFGAIIFLLLALAAIVFAFLNFPGRKIALLVVSILGALFYLINMIMTPGDSVDAMGMKMEYGAGWGFIVGIIAGVIMIIGSILMMVMKGKPEDA